VISSRLRAGLVIAAVVVGSAIAGAAIDRSIVTRGRPDRGRDGGGGRGGRPSPEQEIKRRQEMLDHMAKDLSLTPAQRAGLDSVFQRSDSAFRAIRREMQPKLQAVFETSRSEINARLDSAQRVKFAAMRRPGGGPGGPGGPPRDFRAPDRK
jgi:Spy/CpxP family protein refolding chaperone